MDGVLEIRLLYLTADDQAPVGAASEVLPFHLMAAAGWSDAGCGI